MLAEMDADLDALSSGDEQLTEPSLIAAVYTQISVYNRRQRSLISESTSLKIVVYQQSLERPKGRNGWSRAWKATIKRTFQHSSC